MRGDTKAAQANGSRPSGVLFFERIEASAEHLEDLDTARLVCRIQAGDREAFASLYMRFFDRVYGYLRVALADRHEAEDLTQQVFLEVGEALHRYERRAVPFRSWLFTIVRNTAIKHLRRQHRLDLVGEEPLVEMRESGGHSDGDTTALDWINDQDLMVFVERLPLAQRQVLLLRFMVGMSHAEIAQVLGRREDAVRAMQSRALGFLRQRLVAIGRAPKKAGRRAPTLAPIRQLRVLRERRYGLLSPSPRG